MKYRRLCCVDRVVCNEQLINAHRILVRTPPGKLPLVRPKMRWEGTVITRLFRIRQSTGLNTGRGQATPIFLAFLISQMSFGMYL
jgi:hypothetical protein